MVFINQRCRQAMNEPLFTVFFVATIVYNPVLFKNVEKVFLFDIMTRNRRIMLLTRSCNICYLLTNLYLFSTGILRKVLQEVAVTVIVVVNAFSVISCG